MSAEAEADQSGASFERVLATGSNVVSALAVLGMLTGAIVVVADVLMRWFFNIAVVALNEVMAQVFAMAIAATLPAGAARRVNLKVDLLGQAISPRIAGWLNVIGSALLAIFFALLAWRIWTLGIRFQGQGRATLILNWPIAPTYFFVACAMALAALVQVGNVVLDLLRPAPEQAGTRTRPIGAAVLLLLAALLIATGLWYVIDHRGLVAFATGSPGWFVVVAFLVLWLGVLAQLPIAAVTGFMGVFGTMLFIGGASAGNVFATDAMDFLSNPQVATLPLFLMMGSFAVAAGISTDIYRLAYAVLGRIRGGLAYATVAGCAGFGAVSGSSIATAATFGHIALPEMAKRGYAPHFATGSVAAGGTLGALVPPSGAIILFALLTEESIATLFMAAVVPALLAIVLYFAAITVVVRVNPDAAPPPDARDRAGAARAHPRRAGDRPLQPGDRRALRRHLHGDGERRGGCGRRVPAGPGARQAQRGALPLRHVGNDSDHGPDLRADIRRPHLFLLRQSRRSARFRRPVDRRSRNVAA